MKPLHYRQWVESPVSRKQRNSRQWEGQRDNYYKLYCYWWCKKNNIPIGLGIMFQACYSARLSDILPEANTLLKLIKPHVSTSWHQPVILGIEHGISFTSNEEENETPT